MPTLTPLYLTLDSTERSALPRPPQLARNAGRWDSAQDNSLFIAIKSGRTIKEISDLPAGNMKQRSYLSIESRIGKLLVDKFVKRGDNETDEDIYKSFNTEHNLADGDVDLAKFKSAFENYVAEQKAYSLANPKKKADKPNKNDASQPSKVVGVTQAPQAVKTPVNVQVAKTSV